MVRSGVVSMLVFAVMVGEEAFAVEANERSLMVDAIVRVKDVPVAGTRVLVLQMDGTSQVLTENVARFALKLELQTNYLLSFEREGCVTKQLLFDTHVPGEQVDQEEFTFPFQVTLEKPANGVMYAYDGPVGLIRFDASIADFGYDTNYKVSRNDAFSERLDALHQQLDPPETPAATTSLPVERKVGSETREAPQEVQAEAPAQGFFEELAPTRSEVQPMLHAIAKPAVEQVMLKPFEEELTPLPLPQVMQQPLTQAPETPQQTVHEGRSTQVVSTKLNVVTITRLTEDDRSTEYRRVVSYYGGVTFFRNGLACSSFTYDQGVAP